MKRIIPLVVLVCALAAVSSAAGAIHSPDARPISLERYRPTIHNQHDWFNRAQKNRCRSTLTLDQFTKTPLAAVLPAWRPRHVFYATRRHHRAQEKSSRCVPTSVSGAIEYVFGPYATEAHRVASCESGHSRYAVNGQYVGVFQMGTWERSTYGWYTVGAPAIVQVRSAHNYFVASGSDWSPWECQP